MPRATTRVGKTTRSKPPTIVRVSQRWTVTIPASVRAGLSPDTIFEVARRDDGVIELRPRILTDPSQAWFWSPRWQQMEREADEDIAAGRIKRFDSLEELFADLDAAKPE
jgi:bifunctional DNA-binding transcriptional regulator/antitoxin component of YhaV-PrlF toxin-antitoxin module